MLLNGTKNSPYPEQTGGSHSAITQNILILWFHCKPKKNHSSMAPLISIPFAGVLPKYFNSEWSVAQFRLHEGSQYVVAFGHQKNTIVILGMDGRWVSFCAPIFTSKLCRWLSICVHLNRRLLLHFMPSPIHLRLTRTSKREWICIYEGRRTDHLTIQFRSDLSRIYTLDLQFWRMSLHLQGS